ncbi:MAG: protein kinase [Planctomycetota bacterium]
MSQTTATFLILLAMSTSELQHPEDRQLLEFALGRSEQADQQAIATHIGTCESCCEKLDTLPGDRFTELARDAARLSTSSGETRGFELAATGLDIAIPAELKSLSRYRIIERIGAGGMGEVYRAEHRLMGRMVALKVINRDLTANSEAVSRFKNEVRAAARLNHPNIVASYDAENANDLHFLVMELVEGESLDSRVKQAGPLSPGQVLDVMKQVTAGLGAASEQGMIHRDIKPHNLMMDSTGCVKILDFGLARFEREHFAREQADTGAGRNETYGLTTTNIAIGTPDYLAPEQARDAANADIRSDIYSLGCTAYYLLTGTVPFPGGDALDKIIRRQTEDPPSPGSLRSGLPESLVAIIERCMSRNPAERFQTPVDLATALETVVLDSPRPSIEVTSRTAAQKTTQNKAPLLSRRMAIVVASALAVVGAIGWMVAGGLAVDTGPQVLVITPNRSYYPDYFPVKQEFADRGITITTAAVEPKIEPVAREQGEAFNADLRLEDVDASKFDIVVFVGGDTTQLIGGGTGFDGISRIVDMIRRADGLVGGLCAGTQVLDGLDLPHPEDHSYDPVTLHDGIVRTPDPEFAAPFVSALLEEYEYRRSPESSAK